MKTYFIDTNYFLRYLIKDNLKQYKVAYDLIDEALSGNVILISSVIVFFEMVWVMSSFYDFDKNTIIKQLRKLLSLGIIRFENHELLEKSLTLYSQTSIELGDCYNSVFAHSVGVIPSHFATFDKKLMTAFANVTL